MACIVSKYEFDDGLVVHNRSGNDYFQKKKINPWYIAYNLSYVLNIYFRPFWSFDG